MDTSCKIDAEFRNDVIEALARHESSFDQIAAALQSILTELQALRVSRTNPHHVSFTTPKASSSISFYYYNNNWEFQKNCNLCGISTPDSIKGEEMAVVVKKDDAKQKILGSSSNFKNLVTKVNKPQIPVDVVRETRALLLGLNAGGETREPKHDETLTKLDVLIGEMKSILYGVGESEPVPEACLQLTKDIFDWRHFLEVLKDDIEIVESLLSTWENEQRLTKLDFILADKDFEGGRNDTCKCAAPD